MHILGYTYEEVQKFAGKRCEGSSNEAGMNFRETGGQVDVKLYRPAVDSRRKMTVRTLKDCRLVIVIFLSSCGRKGGSRRGRGKAALL